MVNNFANIGDLALIRSTIVLEILDFCLEQENESKRGNQTSFQLVNSIDWQIIIITFFYHTAYAMISIIKVHIPEKEILYF